MTGYFGKFKGYPIYEVSREEYMDKYRFSQEAQYYYITEDKSIVDNAGTRLGKVQVSWGGVKELVEEEHKQYAAWYLESKYYETKLECSKEVAQQCEKTDEETEDFWQKLQDDIEKTLKEKFSYGV